MLKPYSASSFCLPNKTRVGVAHGDGTNLEVVYKSRTTLKDLNGISPNGSIYFVSEFRSGSISDRELVIKSVMLSFKKILSSHSRAVLLFNFFFYFLFSFICCWLIRMIASQPSCFVFQKQKKSNHRIHKHCSLSIPLFF